MMFKKDYWKKALYYGAVGTDMLNSWPLTYVYEDFRSGFVLTPSHFLVTNKKLGLCTTEDIEYHEDEDFQPNRDSITKLCQRHLNLYSGNFGKRNI